MKTSDQNNVSNTPQAPIIALDLGEKRVGVAVSDELSITITRLKVLTRGNWKQLLHEVDDLVRRFDAQTVVIGLPLRLNGSSGDAAKEVHAVALKFARSLNVPVYLQDERLSSVAAEENLRAEGHSRKRVSELVDSEAAAVILRDFLVSDQQGQERLLVSPLEQTL
jgi:putative Holliday junction resolvase